MVQLKRNASEISCPAYTRSLLYQLSNTLRQQEDDTRRSVLVSVAGFVNTLALEYNCNLDPAARYGGYPEPGAKDEGDEGDEGETDEGGESQDGEGGASDVESEGAPDDAPGVPYQRLEPVTLVVTSTVGKDALESARNGFFAEILALETAGSRDFTENDAIAVTNFFFANMMGDRAAVRLRRLVQFYTADRKGEADMGAAARAETAADNDSFTPEMRRFFSTFAQAQRTTCAGNPEFAAIERFQRHIELLSRYRELQAAVRGKDGALLLCLKQAGFQPKRGVRWPSLVTSFVAQQLGLTTIQLQNACQAALGVRELIARFGPGVVCVLPANAMNRLNRLGNNRMGKVYGILHRHAQFLSPVCRLLDEHVYQPITRGEPITLGAIAKAEERPLLERIEDAVMGSR